MARMKAEIEEAEEASAAMAAASNPILAYLTRKPCAICHVDLDGIYRHCEECQKLYNAALVKASQPDVPASAMTYEQMKKAESDRFYEIGQMKNSHSWVGSRNFVNVAKSQIAPYASHCTKCGVALALFKGKPNWCPKKDG